MHYNTASEFQKMSHDSCENESSLLQEGSILIYLKALFLQTSGTFQTSNFAVKTESRNEGEKGKEVGIYLS